MKMRRGQIKLAPCLIVTAVLAGVAMLLPAALLLTRENARRGPCQDNLRQIGAALEGYHGVQSCYPPAAVQPNSRAQWVLKGGLAKMTVTYANWATLLLPYLGEEALAAAFDPRRPISDPANAGVRTASPAWSGCPADTYNRSDNPYRCALSDGSEDLYARGNYAINAGSSFIRAEPGTPGRPIFDGMIVLEEGRKRSWWGNGIAGVNKSFSRKDIVNGLATTVAVDEIRAGLAAMDSRGAWALGHVGCSITYAHGVYGDAGGPNGPRPEADDVVGCAELSVAMGRPEELVRLGMPCCDYLHGADQATARSMHPGGVNVLMLDGAVHFVNNSVDLSVWHVIHSRQTPEQIAIESFVGDPAKLPPAKNLLSRTGQTAEPLEASPVADVTPSATSHSFLNSIGMEFVEVPAGEFTMGMADEGWVVRYPELVPAHRVRITKPFGLGVYAVTQGEYIRIMGSNPSWFSAGGGGRGLPQPAAEIGGRAAPQDTSQFPVEQVSWHDATEFCRRLSAVPEEQAAGRSYRLPTEAEWEYACRAGSAVPGPGTLGQLPKPAEEWQRNAFGLCGMRGNVFQWCSDWYSEDYYTRSPVDDPQGPPSGYLRVVRGSDWINTGEECQKYAHAMSPTGSSRFVGFRVVCVK